MLRVNLYIETDSKAQARRERTYSYLLECTLPSGKSGTKLGKGTCRGTYHETILKAITEGIQKLDRKCQVYIYTQDSYVGSKIPGELTKMQEFGFRTKSGRLQANAKEWSRLYQEVCKHQTLAVIGRHKYSEKMERMMKNEKI